MSDQEAVKKNADEPIEPVQRQFTDIEKVAMEIGWNPDHEGDGAVDAKTFIVRSREIMSTMSKKAKNLERSYAALTEGLSTIQAEWAEKNQKEVTRLQDRIAQLESERQNAIYDGDRDKIIKTDSQIKQLKSEIDETKTNTKPITPPPPPEFLEWIDENQWYKSTDPKFAEMQGWVNTYAQSPELKGLPPERFFKHITKKAREFFPENFQDKKEQKEPVVNKSVAPVASDTPSKTTGRKQRWTAKDLNGPQKAAGEQFVMFDVRKSLDEYAQLLGERGRLK